MIKIITREHIGVSLFFGKINARISKLNNFALCKKINL